MQEIGKNDLINDAENIKEAVGALRKVIYKLSEKLAGKPITAKTADHLSKINTHLKRFTDGYDSDTSLEKIGSLADGIMIYSGAIVQSIKVDSSDEEMVDLIQSIKSASAKLKVAIEDRKVTYSIHDFTPFDKETEQLGDPNLKEIRKLENKNNILTKENSDYINSVSLNLKKSIEVESRLDSLTEQVQNKLNEVNLLYTATLSDFKQKDIAISALLGAISGKAIADSYEKSASSEKKMADILRYCSLFFMLGIVLVVGFSFYETTTDSFQSLPAAFRIIFSIFLSIPAAYLARESAKHRQQQYAHLQTSLDLKSITPYIASLPTDEQHKLKSQMASRIFASKNHAQIGQDSYPINTNDILIALLNKIDLPIDKSRKND